MRPQARIALAIGAIVLAGLVAYVLMPRQPKVVTPPTPPVPELPEPGSTSLPTSEPTTAPEYSDPFAGPTTSATQQTPATLSLENQNALPPSDRWDSAFQNGRIGTPAPGSTETAPRTYTVQSGDSMYTISQKVFGNTRQVDAIRKANPGVNPNRLRVGQILKMPQAASTPAAPTGTRSGASDHSASSLGTGRTYTVQAGDNLRKISVRFYGNTSMWQKIYDLNRQVIGSRPDNLRVGMVLRLPAGANTGAGTGTGAGIGAGTSTAH